MTPYRLLRPYPGFHHTIPHMLAGCLMLHPVSVPRAAGTMPLATATADHDEDHPGIRDASHGLCVSRNAEFSPLDPMAYSSIFVFQNHTNPASFIRSVTVDSYRGMNHLSIFDPACVRIHFSQNTSFTAIGSPELTISLGSELNIPSSTSYFFARSRK